MNNLIEFAGTCVSNGARVPFEVVIRMPEQDELTGDYMCRVLSDQLFPRTLSVYGVSHTQAIRLAIMIVQAALTGCVITENGQGPATGKTATGIGPD